MRRPAIAFLILAMSLGPASARAQQNVDDQLIGDGIALRKEGRDAEALALFERARAHHPTARAFAQIALAHQALMQWTEAERSLLKALAQGEDEWVARNRVYLEKSLTTVQSHLAWLSVDSNVAGAELFVGGDLVGRVPLDGPLRVPTGALAIEVRADGYATAGRDLQIEPGAKLHEFVRLEAERTDAGEPIVERQAFARAPVRDAAAHTPSGKRTAAWIALAGAGALLGGGVAMQVLRQNEVALYNDDNVCLRGPGTRDDVCGSHRSAANLDMAAAIAFYAGSAVLGATSTYLFVVSRPATAAPATSRVSCRVAGLSVACGGVF